MILLPCFEKYIDFSRYTLSMATKLTNKQNLFAKHYSLGKSGKDAAILAGYSERSADAIASENLRKPEVSRAIETILDKSGLSDEALAQRLRKAIDAGLTRRANNADALKGIKMAYEIKDRFPSQRQKLEISQTSEIEMKLQGKSLEEVIAFIGEITRKTNYYISKLKERDSFPQ